jgi:predicted outer membrane repeat protein
MFSTWFFGKRKSASSSRRQGQARRPKARFRPQLEILEDRLAPAFFMVTTTADNLAPTITAGHAGTANDPYLAPTLRSAIYAAESDSQRDNTITFDPSLAGQTITLNAPSHEIYWDQANLTIQGPGSNEARRVTISGDPSANPSFAYFNFFYFNDGFTGGGTISLSNLNFVNMAGGRTEGGSAIEVFPSDPFRGTDTLNVDHCDFLNNSVTGAIGIQGRGTVNAVSDWHTAVNLTNCILANNSAESVGGAITNQNATLNLTSCTLYNNSVKIDAAAAQASGGAIQCTSGDLNLSGCTLSNNSAVTTGGVDNSSGGAISANGGSLSLSNNCILGPSTQNNVAVPGNSAAYGGAIFADESTSLSIMGCTFTSNSARINGGAIDVAATTTNINGTVTINGSTFSGNQAIGGSGGAMYLQSNSITISSCTVNNNSAAFQGGGLFIDPATVRIISSTISNNSAPVGADVYNLNSALTLINSTVTNFFNNGGTITTPDSVATNLDARISALAQSGALTADQAAGLRDKLQAATQALDSGNLTAGLNDLNAFVNQLDAFVKSDVLTAAQAQPLIDGANQLITALNSAGV